MSEIYNLIKQICACERQASYLVEICYGTVVSVSPLKIKLNQKQILNKNFFIAGEKTASYKFETGDKLILFRVQGGQKYLIFDKKGEL